MNLLSLDLSGAMPLLRRAFFGRSIRRTIEGHKELLVLAVARQGIADTELEQALHERDYASTKLKVAEARMGAATDEVEAIQETITRITETIGE